MIGLNMAVPASATMCGLSHAFNPEANLGVPTSTHGVGGFTHPHGGTQNTVFAMDFIGLDGSGGGLIFELGASAVGTLVCFRPNGNFVARAGSGAVDGGGASWASGTSYVELAAGTIAGNGTLVVEFSVSGGVDDVRVWWRGELVGVSSVNGRTAGMSDAWGGDGCHYLQVASGQAGTGFGGSVVPYATASNLRIYAPALVSGG